MLHDGDGACVVSQRKSLQPGECNKNGAIACYRDGALACSEDGVYVL